MPSAKVITKKHYSSLDQAKEYLRRKLILEAKLTIHKEGKEIEKERNRLRKAKSELLDKLEDSFEAALYLIEASDRSKSKDDAIKIISPEYILKSLDVRQQKKLKKDLADVHYFEEKISREFHGITKRIFSEKRMNRLAFGLFTGFTRQLLLQEEKKYRVAIAYILLERTIEELEDHLPIEYSSFLRNDFQRTKDLARLIDFSVNKRV